MKFKAKKITKGKKDDRENSLLLGVDGENTHALASMPSVSWRVVLYNERSWV